MRYYYRYEEVHYAPPWDGYNDCPGRGWGTTEVRLRTYPVIKHTDKGVWLSNGPFHSIYEPDKRFVLKHSRKKFACSTKKGAMESFRARKRAQIRILKAQVARTERALLAADKVDIGPEDGYPVDHEQPVDFGQADQAHP